MKTILCLLAVFFSSAYAQNVMNEYKEIGPIHEAYILQEANQLYLEATSRIPPEPLAEIPPFQPSKDTLWIPGYWQWCKQNGQYLWVSGVWRKPPPNCQWVPGYWKNYPEGWVRLCGFWTPSPIQQLRFASFPPPDPIDEAVSYPPEPVDAYFWAPGYWFFAADLQYYVWYKGRWDLLNPHWVYVPPRYLWREDRYLFIPGFWDFSLDGRGVAYYSAHLNPHAVGKDIFEPKEVIPPLFALEQKFVQWPNYTSLFHYHYHFHRDIWASWGAAPPWWDCAVWWCYPTYEQWALWWWWCHSGYPNPTWLTKEQAKWIAPPPNFVRLMMQNSLPPLTMTSKGAVGDDQLLEAIFKVTGGSRPILPSDPKLAKQILEMIQPLQEQAASFAPEGGESKGFPSVQKLFFGPPAKLLKAPPRRVTLPPFPSL